jgi:hypothetical protein
MSEATIQNRNQAIGNQISEKVIGSAFKVGTALGSGNDIRLSWIECTEIRKDDFSKFVCVTDFLPRSALNLS